LFGYKKLVRPNRGSGAIIIPIEVDKSPFAFLIDTDPRATMGYGNLKKPIGIIPRYANIYCLAGTVSSRLLLLGFYGMVNAAVPAGYRHRPKLSADGVEDVQNVLIEFVLATVLAFQLVY
jgi:hypothetical protein